MSDLVDRAACRQVATETFFPPGRRDNPLRREVVLVAMTVCSACSVRQQCAELAVRAKATHGVFAGVDLGDGGHGDEFTRAVAELKRIAKGVQ